MEELLNMLGQKPPTLPSGTSAVDVMIRKEFQVFKEILCLKYNKKSEKDIDKSLINLLLDCNSD